MPAVKSTMQPVPEAARGPSRWPLSVPAYHALTELGLIPRRTELIHGFVYHKMSKTPLHSLLVLRLIERLREQLPAGHHLRSAQPIACPDFEPEPDISIVRGAVEDFARQHPSTTELVVEVCVTSHDYDREKSASTPPLKSRSFGSCLALGGRWKSIAARERALCGIHLSRRRRHAREHRPAGRGHPSRLAFSRMNPMLPPSALQL